MPSKRKHIRLKTYDYSQAGGYFVTICTFNKLNMLGEIINDEMKLNEYGKIVEEEWLRTPQVRENISLGEFVIMPNHMHGVVFIDQRAVGQKRATQRVAPTHYRQTLVSGSLGAIIAQFKAITSKRINALRAMTGHAFWQRSFYEHVIRNEADHMRICEYIMNNPQQWAMDEENTDRLV